MPHSNRCKQHRSQATAVYSLGCPTVSKPSHSLFTVPQLGSLLGHPVWGPDTNLQTSDMEP